MISIVLWIVPMVPQLAENYRRKSCEGLSVGFLLFWIIGDSMNLLGAYLTRQLVVRKRTPCANTCAITVPSRHRLLLYRSRHHSAQSVHVLHTLARTMCTLEIHQFKSQWQPNVEHADRVVCSRDLHTDDGGR
jgi:uncharacterized protein with PQ loop repeat